MKKSTIILLSCFLAGGVLILSMLFGGISQYNTAKNLKLHYEAKEKANTAIFDNMWKKITQTSQIPGEKAKQVKEILNAYVTGRGGNDSGKVVSVIREAVPNIELPEYGQLMNIITGSRDTWTRNQEELVNVANEYNKYITDIGIIRTITMRIGGFEKVNPKVITSDKTEEVFSTGKDNDVGLFNNTEK
jgi:hypothetical protein